MQNTKHKTIFIHGWLVSNQDQEETASEILYRCVSSRVPQVAGMLRWRQTLVKEGCADMIINVKESYKKMPMIGKVL